MEFSTFSSIAHNLKVLEVIILKKLQCSTMNELEQTQNKTSCSPYECSLSGLQKALKTSISITSTAAAQETSQKRQPLSHGSLHLDRQQQQQQQKNTTKLRE